MGQSRTEDILENILGAQHQLEPPQSRVEALLIKLGEKIDEGPDMDEIEELIEEEVSEQMAALEALVGTPLVASTVSDMTDTNKIYVYVGSETGYTNGDWYYYNGSSWISGGVYNSTALETDTTLSIPGAAADAKKTGDEIATLKEDLTQIETSAFGDAVDGKFYLFTDLAKWAQGYWQSNGTIKSNNKNIACSAEPFYLPAGATLVIEPGSLVGAGRRYTKSGNTYTSVESFSSMTEKTTLSYDTGYYIGLNFRTSDSAVITPSDFDGKIYIVSAWVNHFGVNDAEIDALQSQLGDAVITKIIGKNLYNPDLHSQSGKMYYVADNVYTISFTPIDASSYRAIKIPISDTKSKLSVRTFDGGRAFYSYYFVNDDGDILSRGSISLDDSKAGYAMTIPTGATYWLASMTSGSSYTGRAIICYGQNVPPYVPYEEHFLINGFKLANMSDLPPAHEYLKLPKKIEMIAGSPFELFYKGICNCLDSDLYDFEFTFDGTPITGSQAWKRKFTASPVSADVGTHTVTVVLRDNNGEQIDSGTIDMVVNDVPTSPDSEKVILCIGDSLTNGGTWPKELRRRLTSDSGSPTGFDLSNITFIGTRQTSDGTRYEGYGGWTFTSYSTANSSSANMWVTCSHDKTDVDQHSVYKDGNNVKWKLETIEEGQIKIIMVSSSGTLPSTGTLTWVSGGENHNSIVYTASEQAAGNPFWNETLERNDFVTYASQFDVDHIDHCIILLGWNSTGTSETYYKGIVETFLDSLLDSTYGFPNCKITLVGLQVPSRDGMGSNYGTGWKYYEKLQHVWNLQEWYQELCEDEYPTADYVCLSAQFDTEYNCRTTTQDANLRNSTSVTVQSNAVHPAESGLLEIADAVCRLLVGRL